MRIPLERRVFLGVFLAGCVLRVLLAFVAVPAWEAGSGVASAPDAYPLLAESIVEGESFGYAPAGASPTTVRGPGFPIWLAASVATGLDDTRWLAFWGGLPGILAGAGLAGWCTRRFGAIAGLAAGAVAVLHPLPSLIASRAMGDDFYGALGLGAAAAWIAALEAPERRRGLAWSAVSGALLAWQMLARSSGLLTLVVLSSAALGRMRRKPWLGLTLAGVALLPPLAWSIRTSSLEGRPVFVHSLGAYNFWIGEGFDRFGAGEPPSGNYPEIVQSALATAGPEFEDDRFWYAALEPQRAAELDRRLGRAARERIVRDPLGYARRVVAGVPAFWFRAQTRHRSLQYALVVAPVLLLAAFGVRRAAADSLGRLLLLSLIAHNVAYAMVLPMARMSVQVYPALALLAGAGTLALVRRFRGP